MTEAKRKRIKPDQKQRTKQFLYYRRSNVSILGYSGPTGIADRYLLTRLTYADPTKSLKDLFLYFSPGIFEVDPYCQADYKTVPFNKLFEFMVQLYHLHEKYLPPWIKKTEEINQSVYDIMGKGDDILNNRNRSIIKERVESLYLQSASRVSKSLEKIMDTNSNEYNNGFAQVQILKQDLIRKYQHEILSITDPKIQIEDVAPLFIRKQLTTLMDIQFSRKYYRNFKMKDFLQSYGDYWLAQIPCSESQQVAERKLIIKRYTPMKNVQVSASNIKEILMNLHEYVDLRDQDIPYHQYVPEHIEMIRQLGKELREHKLKTGKHYPLLHPKYVIFNQLTLKINLSYQPPLFAALGLLKMPCSPEQAIAFAATPKLFDQYSAPIQILKSSHDEKVGSGEQIFYDMFYAMDSLVDAHQARYKYQKISKPLKGVKGELQMKDIKLQRDKESEVWRYLMVSTYLLNGSEYYKKDRQPLVDFQGFKQFLIEERRKIEHFLGGVKQYAENVMGDLFTNFLKKAKMELDESQTLSMTIFDTFLGVKQQVSQISSQTRFWRVSQLLKTRRRLKSDLLDNIQKHKELKRMMNITRYFIALYLILIDSISNLQLILEMYTQSFKKGRVLLNYVGDKINFSEFEQAQDEDNIIHKAYTKAKDYQYKSDGRSVLQLQHFKDHHGQAYISLDPCYNTYFQIKQKIKLVVFGKQEQGTKDAISSMITDITTLLLQLRAVIIKIIDKELERTNEAVRDEDLQRTLLIHSFHTKTRLLLLLNHDNYTELDSLISPIIVTEKEIEKKGSEMEKKERWAQLIPVYQYALEILREHTGQQPSETGNTLIPVKPS